MNEEDNLDEELKKINNLLSQLTTYEFITTQNINLDLAGIFYVNAWLHIKEGQEKFQKLENELNLYNEVFEKRAKKFRTESDDFVTFQLAKLRELEVHYEPVIRCFSTSKILLVCCAETFVNETANTALKDQSLKEFYRLSIIGKWLFIQRILNIKEPIEINEQPFSHNWSKSAINEFISKDLVKKLTSKFPSLYLI